MDCEEKMKLAMYLLASDSITYEDALSLVDRVSRCDQFAIEWLSNYITEMDRIGGSVGGLQLSLSKAVHGKRKLQEVWEGITHSSLREDQKSLLLKFFDGPFFRPQLVSPNVANWVIPTGPRSLARF